MQARRAIEPEQVEAGKRLQEKRRAEKVSVALMAHLLDCDPKTITNYEKGRTNANGAVEFAYDNIQLLIKDRLGKGTWTWTDPFGSDDLRLFDPDEPLVVIDLTDRRIAQVAQNESLSLYAAAG